MYGRMILLALPLVLAGCASAPESSQSSRSSQASERAEKSRSQLRSLMNSDVIPEVKRCTKLSNAAAKTMSARQAGVPMTKSERIVDGTRRDLAKEGVPAEYAKALVGLYRRMLIDAYDRPRHHTVTHRQRSITEFENKWHRECTRALEK